MTDPDYRALCAALVDEAPYESPTTCLARAALAQPEPEGPTLDDVSELCEEFGFYLDESYDNLESAETLWEMFRAVLARWGTPTNIINQED
jgi:hypothetical protein